MLPLSVVDVHFLSFAIPIPLPPKSHKECALMRKLAGCHVGFENQNNKIFCHVISSQIVSGIPSPL